MRTCSYFQARACRINSCMIMTLFLPVSCKDSVRSILWRFPLHICPPLVLLTPSLLRNPWAPRQAAVPPEWLSPAGSMLPADCWEQCRKWYTLRPNPACNQSNPHSEKYTKQFQWSLKFLGQKWALMNSMVMYSKSLTEGLEYLSTKKHIKGLKSINWFCLKLSLV